MSRTKIIDLLLYSFFVFFLISILATYEHFKKNNNDEKLYNDISAIKYESELVNNLADYMDKNNITADFNTKINTNDIVKNDECNGEIGFDIKKDFIINNINLNCEKNENQKILSFSYKGNEKIENFISLDDGYLLIIYDEIKNISYLLKIDNNFETKWKQEINKYTYNGKFSYVYNYVKDNKYYIVFNYEVDDKDFPTLAEKLTALVTVDKNGLNYNTHFIKDVYFPSIKKIEVLNNIVTLFSSDTEYINYNVDNETFDKKNYGQALDYNHEKLIEYNNNIYYTYDHIYKILYKYPEPSYLMKEIDLVELLKDKQTFIYNYDEFSVFTAEHKIFVPYTEFDSEINYTYTGVLIFDLDYNLLKDISFSHEKYNLKGFIDDNNEVLPNYNKLNYINVIDNKLYVYSEGKYNNEYLMFVNIISLEDYSMIKKVYYNINIKSDKNTKKILSSNDKSFLYFSSYGKMNFIVEYKY